MDTSVCVIMFVNVPIRVHKIPKSLVKPDACTVNTFAPRHFEAQYRKKIFYVLLIFLQRPHTVTRADLFIQLLLLLLLVPPGMAQGFSQMMAPM